MLVSTLGRLCDVQNIRFLTAVSGCANTVRKVPDSVPDFGETHMIVAANWKMNPAMEEAGKLAMTYASETYDGVTRILFPPYPYLVQMATRLAESEIRVGGQDCHAATSGAHTGDVAAHMLAACGADIVLLGHSERRSNHGEDDALVRAKAEAALADGLSVMMCVGETLQERDAGNAQKVVLSQLDGSMPEDIDPQHMMVAYEPVWAIGTGKVASTEDIAAIHEVIRSWLDERGLKTVPVLYGGSVKPDNAGAIFAVAHVDGALVGGASLKADDFAAICQAAMEVLSSQ